MSSGRRSLVLAALGAVVGGAVVAGAVSALGVGERTTTTTIVQQAPLRAEAASRSGATEAGEGLTPRALFERDAPSVVQVRADVVRASTTDPGAVTRSTSVGSGFVVDADGRLLTAAHVVAGAVKVTVALSSGRSVEADVLGKDTASDLAVLRVDAGTERLRPLAFGSAEDAEVGDPVVAIANPYGGARTLTQGVVSGRQSRAVAADGARIDDVVQTDAAVDPSGSGGPLIDAAGRVIGVATRLGDADGETCFVVPSDTAKRVLAEVGSADPDDDGTQPYLGLAGLTVDASLARLDLPTSTGVLVQSVQRDSPAAKAGLRAGSMTSTLADGTNVVVGGDVVQSVDGAPVASADDLSAAIEEHDPGDDVEIGALRGTTRITLDVHLGTPPG